MESAENNPSDAERPEGEGDAAAEAGEASEAPKKQKSSGPALTKWREIWPLPLLGAGGVLLAAGVYMAVSTVPDPVFTPALEDADRLIKAGAYEEAIAELNDRVHPYVGRPELAPQGEARYRVLLARALYGGQAGLEFPQPVNDENIVAQYLAAEKLTGALEPDDEVRLITTLISQGKLDRAAARVAGLDNAAVRARLHRDLIEANRALARPDYTRLLTAIDEYLEMPAIEEADRVWGLARRAETQIELGYTNEAINSLLREMPLLVGRGIEGVGELYVLLGRGYLESDAPREAIAELRRADRDELLSPADPARPLAKLYLARAIETTASDEIELREARDLYETVAQGVNPPEIRLPAMFGLARTEAGLGDDQAAFDAFGMLSDAMRERGAPPRPSAESVGESLIGLAEQHEAMWLAGGDATAVGLMRRYADIAKDLFSVESMPPALLSLQSRAHEAAARSTLGMSPETTGQRFSLEALRAFDPSTLREAKRHLIQSASYARLHADRYVIDDYDTYADALWRSAMLSDAAGDRAQAIATLALFAETVQNDPRQPEARYRLGQMFQARGEYLTAASYYEDLIEESRQEGTSPAGQWADLSFVPLAQCYIADSDDKNDDDAVRLLERAVDGTRGGPERPEFAQAVVELGNLAMRQGRYADAIERYEESLARDAEGTPTTMVRFKLADAFRLLSEEIEDRLDEPLSDRERGILASERDAHLRSAVGHFKEVRDALGAADPRSLTELQRVYLRNSHFYLGDCAFDLGQFSEAIDYYDRAKSSYSNDPVVLVALIQIVNAYLELGDTASARTANDRAKAYYQTLPDEAFDDPNLPMSRREWESWLDANTRLVTGYTGDG